MRHRKILPLYFLFSFVLSLVLATSANAYIINTQSCNRLPTNSGGIETKDITIENISTDKSALQVVCLDGQKPVTIDLEVKAPELKSALSQFGKGDRINLEYKQEKDVNILQSFSVETIKIELSSVILFFSITILLLGLLTWGLTGFGLRWNFLNLLIGYDNRLSNSKTQIAVWFFILISSYVAANALRGFYGGFGFVGGVTIPQNLLLLSGLSAFTFLTAKGITQSNVENPNKSEVRDLKANSNGEKPRFSDLFQDDLGRFDLGDFQMIIVTLLAVVVYLIQVIGFLHTIELHQIVTLPDLDTTILSTFGLGQGSYLVKKFLGEAGGGSTEAIRIAETAKNAADKEVETANEVIRTAKDVKDTADTEAAMAEQGRVDAEKAKIAADAEKASAEQVKVDAETVVKATSKSDTANSLKAKTALDIATQTAKEKADKAIKAQEILDIATQTAKEKADKAIKAQEALDIAKKAASNG